MDEFLFLIQIFLWEIKSVDSKEAQDCCCLCLPRLITLILLWQEPGVCVCAGGGFTDENIDEHEAEEKSGESS